MKIIDRGSQERADVDVIQDQIAAKQKRISAIDNEPLSEADTRDVIRSRIKQGMAYGAVALPSVKVGKPHHGMVSEDFSAMFLNGIRFAFFVEIFGGPEKVEELWIEALKRISPNFGLPLSERRTEIRQLTNDIRELERQEERLILALEEQHPGDAVIRRDPDDKKEQERLAKLRTEVMQAELAA